MTPDRPSNRREGEPFRASYTAPGRLDWIRIIPRLPDVAAGSSRDASVRHRVRVTPRSRTDYLRSPAHLTMEPVMPAFAEALASRSSTRLSRILFDSARSSAAATRGWDGITGTATASGGSEPADWIVPASAELEESGLVELRICRDARRFATPPPSTVRSSA
jgi:hypothetical protein